MQPNLRSAFGLVIALCLATLAACQERKTEAESPELQAVRRTAESYIAALKRGDFDQLAALWTPEGDLIDGEGHTVKGRDLVKQLRVGATAAGDREAAITIDSVRLATADVAIEDGRINLPADSGLPIVGRYSAVWVKREGKWLLDSVRESAPHAGSHRDSLQPLGWLVGDWVEKSGTGNVEMNCRWSPDGNFLLRELKMAGPQGQTLSLSQRLGWNPAKKQITAWTFDSDGGFAVGVWSAQGNQWVVNSTGILPDGQPATTVSTYTRQGENAFTWEAKQSAGVSSATTPRVMNLVRRNAAK